MKKTVRSCAGLMMIAACAWLIARREVSASPRGSVPDVLPSTRTMAEMYSMVEVLAAPERFEKRRIQLKGYLDLRFEGTALYLHKEDCDYGLTKNALWIEVPREDWEKTPNGYVIVEAVVNTTRRGHTSAFQAALTDITRIERLWRSPDRKNSK